MSQATQNYYEERQAIGRRINKHGKGKECNIVEYQPQDNYLPPLFILSREKVKQSLRDHLPPCSIFSANKSGWMTTEELLQSGSNIS